MVGPHPYVRPIGVSRLLLTLLALVVLLVPLVWQRPRAFPAPVARPALDVASTLAQLPLMFMPNWGQSDPNVRFQAAGLDGKLQFMADQVVLALPTATPEAGTAAAPSVVRLQFVDANPAPDVRGSEQQPGTMNYFVGNDPAQWRADLPTYGSLVYEALYEGIDLHYTGVGGQLKGTYTVAPNTDPSRIHWRYAGASATHVDHTTGNLVVTLAGAGAPTLTEQAPVAWQDIAGQRMPVTARYELAADGTIGFALGSYDRTKPLTIDPLISYSTYLGGSNGDEGNDIAVDGQGNVYVVGSTASINFPVKNALQPVRAGGTSNFVSDAFVTKFDARGALVYSTYLGGTNEDFGSGIAVDNAGNVYVTGITNSSDYPVQNALQPSFGGGSCSRFGGPCYDAFVAKLNASGTTLVYSTYLGGNDGDFSRDIALDAGSNVYITGETASPNFPTKNALQATFSGGSCGQGPFPCPDTFVTKLNAQGSALVYSTYLGGSDDDGAAGIAVDSVGNAYVTGNTLSGNFPTKNALQPSNAGSLCGDATPLCGDGFITKLNAQGSALVYSTYLGGEFGDTGAAIAVDSIGNVYVTGSTTSFSFPTKNALQPTFSGYDDYAIGDAFITKLNAQGSALAYSTFLGGNQGDSGRDIAVDTGGTVYVTGVTSSTNFPTTRAPQATFGGRGDEYFGGDAFVTALNAQGTTFAYSTYLGGLDDDGGRGIAADNNGNAYVTGNTYSTDFPTQNALQATNGGSGDAFVVKLGAAPYQRYLPLITTAPPPTVALRGTLAFTRDGNIYAYNFRAKQERLRVTNGRDMQYSPDGMQLAFVRDDGVYVAAANGTNIRRIAALTGVQTPRWSDDNTKLMWERASNEIWTVALPNGTPAKIAAGSDPAWAPDGLRITYVAAGGGQLRLVNWQGQNDWTVVSKIPSNTPPIGPGEGTPPDQLAHSMRSPVWNAQGTFIYVAAFVFYCCETDVFIWERADTTNGGSVFLDTRVNVLNVTGAPDRRAALIHTALGQSGADEFTARSLDPNVPDAQYAWAQAPGLIADRLVNYASPAWSPDSNAVATLRCPNGGSTCDLIVLAPGQAEPQVLLPNVPLQPSSNISWGRGE